jgi:Protein of unknown function (DUF1073)
MAQPIKNSLTRQGSKKDVAQYFDVDQIVSHDFTPDQLRAVVSASWMCQKVVAHIPKEMVNVQFGLTLTGQTGKSRSVQDLTIIQEQLKRLMPWFGEAQKRANIVGKAYLLIQTTDVDPINVDIQNQETIDEVFAEEIEELKYGNTISLNSNNQYGTDDETISAQQLEIRFPYSLPLDWTRFSQIQVSGIDILDGDMYTFEKNKRFLIKNEQIKRSSNIDIPDINIEQTLSKWYNESPDGDDKTLEIIHRSHLIEFTAFDYQPPKTEKVKGSPVDKDLRGKKSCENASFRLTRFITTLLYFESFVNATLNRVHRSEFISYKKENLGDTNLEIARASANNPSHPSAPPNVIDPEAAILDELNTIANSALNLGIVLTDKTSDIALVARSFTGLNNVSDVFRPLIIGASGLTEFSLFGLTMVAPGLSTNDRDRMAISGQVDILFRDAWQPLIESIANHIAISYKTFPTNSYLSVKAISSFRLTELELADVLDKMIDTRLKLIAQGIISKEELRSELKGDGVLGKYFSLSEPDKATQKEIQTIAQLNAEATQIANATLMVNSQVSTTQQDRVKTNIKTAKISKGGV